MLSRATLTLLGSMAVAAGVIYFVHHNQSADRKVNVTDEVVSCARRLASGSRICMFINCYSLQRMRQGVERDMERQLRKEENRRLLEEQIELERKLKERDKDRHTHNGR